MAEFEDVGSIRGPKLSDLSQHVRDVLAIELKPEDEYVLSQLALESYDFTPYALVGLSAAMQTPAGVETRAKTTVTVPVADDEGGTDAVARDVMLYGPGDVLSIHGEQVVRRYPAPGSVNAEETFHAHVEFDRPELPWVFSAQTPTDRMRPWITLVVFEESEIEWQPANSGLQPVIEVDADRLPDLAAAHLWAHAQAVSGPASLSARLSTAYAPVNISRLLAARVLTQNTNYVACVVPTTDAGVKVGLGLPAGSLDPAWQPGDGRVRLPVYDHWSFRTAPDGDFARLARRLEGIAAPWRIGRRFLDTSRPGAPLEPLAAGAPGRRQVIRCALYSVNPPPTDAPAEDAAWSAARVAKLKAAVEAAAVMEGSGSTDPGTPADLPLVGPRLYASGQRGASTMPVDDWFEQLNVDPANRVVAGLGTRVVRKDQEPLMQAAWAQVGEINAANRALGLAQLARHLAASLHARLAAVAPGRLLQLTRPLATRVRMEGAGLTLHGQEARSATPVTALAGAFRRSTRVMGPLTRRLSAGQQEKVARIVGTASGAARDFMRPYVELDGLAGLSEAALAALDGNVVARALGVDPKKALDMVKSAAQGLAANPSLATAVSKPALWQKARQDYHVGRALARQIADRITRYVPENPADDVVTARWLAGLAAGLATTEVAGTKPLANVALKLEKVVKAAAKQAPAVPPPVIHPLPHELAGAALAEGPARPGAEVTVAGYSIGTAQGVTGALLRTAAARGPAAPVRGQLSELAAGRTPPAIDRPIVGKVKGGKGGSRLDAILTTRGRALASYVEAASRITVADLRRDVASLVDGAGALALPATPDRPQLAVTKAELLLRLDPARTVVEVTAARLQRGGIVPADWFSDTLIRPVMAAPRFDRPMYKALDEYDRDWLVPGLTTVEADEFVTVLSSNDAFVEAFLVGLSDEMGRELLWREYPTDRRGTYFHRFWDPKRDELRQEIHRFTRTRLGSHVSMGPPGQSGRAVVLIRGEVVRRYPDMTVMAMHDQGSTDGMPILPDAPAGLPEAAPSLFHAFLPPDIMLAGLDITVDALRSPGWWIVLAEHPQAPRFRRQEPDLAGHEVRFATAASNATGATVAVARLENPTRIAFEASTFLPPAD